MATTTQGIEMLLALPGNAGTAQSFLSVYFPAGLDEKARPRARLVESQARQSSAGAVLPMGLPGGPTAGVIAVPFGSEGSMAFAGDEVSSRSVAHLLEGQAQEDGSKALWAFLPQPRPSAGGTSSWPGEEELTKVPEEEIKALVAGSKQPLPTERSRWRSKDVVCLGDELILRAMTDRQNDDWLEFVHLPSRSARQLPAASEGMDAGPVARLLAWPKSQLFQGDEEAREMLRGSCVVVFESGHVRWMEAHPQGLAESLREHFQRQGLRGLMEEELPEEELRELEELELEQLELEAEDLDGEELTEGEGPTEEGSEMPGAPGAKRRQRGSGRGGRGIARPGAGRGSGHGGRGGARVAAQGNTGGGGSGQAGRGRAQGPQGVREELLRRALRQRRQAQKMRNLSGGGREELSSDGKPPKELSSPKHGDEDNKEHIGGNRWAGGTGGADTAGLGGRGGPYRLEKPGQRVRQVSDEAKAQVDAEAQAAARHLGQEALRRRLEEIHLSGGDYNFYASLLSAVQSDIERLRAVLSGAAARQLERHWRRGQEGELDETRLVDALAGEANVFRRRKEREPRPGEPPMRPKRALFLFDASASMYRFNGADGRLRRTCETAVMIMEALQGLEARFDYAVYCHDGDTPLQELIPFGQPPTDERGRLTVVSKLVASAQYCSSGDNTVEAIEQARHKVLDAGPADDRFVFAFSDANFERYGLTAQALSKALGETNGRDEVRSILFLLATFEDEALLMAKSLPDQVRLCLDPRTLPSELRQEFASRVSRRSAL
ncbi:von Willebrand factor A domain-containing protein 8 (PEX7-binding protein 2) (P7BP2) [Durusdinium trenchii]